MSSLGRTLSQTRKSSLNKTKTLVTQKFPIGIKTPLEPGYRDQEDLFKMNFDVIEQIKDNLKNLILTQKGERLGFPDFGTDLGVIYSNTEFTDDQISEIVMSQIKNVVSKYLPSIRLENFYSNKMSIDESGPNDAGNNFSNALGNLNISNNASISKFEKSNMTKESVYKIDIEFTAGNFSNDLQSLSVYVKSCR